MLECSVWGSVTGTRRRDIERLSVSTVLCTTLRAVSAVVQTTVKIQMFEVACTAGPGRIAVGRAVG